MIKNRSLPISISILFFSLLCSFIYALDHTVYWSSGGEVVCDATNIQSSQVVLPYADGAIVAWCDFRNGESPYCDIYVQKFNESGNAQWGTNGIRITTSTNAQEGIDIVTDYDGGAIVAWIEARTYNNIYAQRIDSDGDIKWTSGGVQIFSGGFYHYSVPLLVSDGMGGAIVTAVCSYSGTNELLAQEISPSGSLLDDCSITEDLDGQYDVVSNAAGGLLVAWEEDEDIYLSKIDSIMNKGWSPGEIAVCDQEDKQWYPTLVSDGGGGAIIGWFDGRNDIANPVDTISIYAQRIDYKGDICTPDETYAWVDNGIEVIDSITGEMSKGPQMASIYLDGGWPGVIPMTIFVWQDSTGGDYDIYCQAITSKGYKANGWMGEISAKDNGHAITALNSDQMNPTLAHNGVRGVLIAYEDYRNAATAVYIQHVDGDNIYFTPDSTRLCSQDSSQCNPIVVNGGVVTWQYDYNENVDSGDIYTQKVELLLRYPEYSNGQQYIS